jgi:uncharacterized protein with HEPN domain
MPKDDWVYVGHILDMSQKALDITTGVSRIDYDKNEVLRLALTHLVQIIGEAAQQVSPDFRERYQNIPWFEIIGMRNRIVHDYLNVDEDIIWEVVHQDLDHLIRELRLVIPADKL